MTPTRSEVTPGWRRRRGPWAKWHTSRSENLQVYTCRARHLLCLEETHGAPSAVSVRSVALAALVVLGLLGTALGACGGRVDLDEPKPLGSATATATSNTPGTGTSSPLPPGSVVPPSTGTSRPPPPPPRCNPDDCALPNTSAATCEGGRCVPAVCDEGFLSCEGDPSNGCEAVAEVLYPDEDGDGFGDRVGKAIGCPKPGVTYVKNGDDC